MLNFLYEMYPFGKGEAFVEYEMRELETCCKQNFRVFVLRGTGTKKRFVPSNAEFLKMNYGKTFKVKLLAFLKMFSLDTLKEIAHVINTKQKEGVLRSLFRIYRYWTVAIGFIIQYKALGLKEDEAFVSYWLNECAFALTELKRKHPNIKIASRGHGYDVFEERCYMPFRRQILSGLDKIFLINEASREYFKKHYGEWLDTSKIEISHLGVDLPQKTSEAEGEIFRVVTCSTVIPLKRIDLMIDALSKIKDKKIEWVHIGDGPLMSDMQNYAKQKLAKTNIEYRFLGQLALSDVHKYYESAKVNLFVNCSDTEGTPVSVMEAMSYGIPCIARNVGGMAEVLTGDCGLLLDENAGSGEISAAIENMYSLDKKVYAEKRANARKKIEDEFDASKTFKDYVLRVTRLGNK